MSEHYTAVESISREYYNSDDADNFYFHVWGGEDIHVGLYEKEGESIFEASRRTVDRMLQMCGNLDDKSRVLDLGSGYGGSARKIAGAKNCSVSCLNISEVENQRNRDKNKKAGLETKIEVIDGSFEKIPSENSTFDLIWSQDAILHSGNRTKVIEEVSRVLKKDGIFIFTDPMQKEGVSKEQLKPVLDRIHLDTLGSFDFYENTCKNFGLEKVEILDLTEQLVNHYSSVLNEINQRYEEIKNVVSEEYLERMKLGLGHWIDAGKKGLLNWGIMKFRKI